MNDAGQSATYAEVGVPVCAPCDKSDWGWTNVATIAIVFAAGCYLFKTLMHAIR